MVVDHSNGAEPTTPNVAETTTPNVAETTTPNDPDDTEGIATDDLPALIAYVSLPFRRMLS